MGIGYTLICRNCGYSKEILTGGGLLGPDSFKDDILRGKFGKEAKDCLEQHPDGLSMIDYRPFSCKCGYITGLPVVVIRTKDGKEIECKKHRCSQCGKIMKADSCGNRTCWKCGGLLTISDDILWD